jgi:hypothetical protein
MICSEVEGSLRGLQDTHDFGNEKDSKDSEVSSVEIMNIPLGI